MGSDNSVRKKVTLDVLACIEIIMFSFALAYALYNGMQFLVIQRRYNSFYLTSFYVLTVLVLGLRIAYFIDNLVRWDFSEDAFDSTWGICDTLALLTYQMLGGLQIG